MAHRTLVEADISNVLSKNSTLRKRVVIMRGLPGSGKSTFARQITTEDPDSVICSADDFWIMSNGDYLFDAKKLPQAHHWCLRQFVEAVQNKYSTVILDNTNLEFKDYSHYVKIAEAYGYHVLVLTFNCSVEDSIARNIHNVPEYTIRKMAERMKQYPVSPSKGSNSFSFDTSSNKC